MTRKKRARKQKTHDDEFLRYVSWVGKQALSGRKGLLTRDEVKNIERRVHRLMLERLPLADLERRIREFRKLPFDRMTYEDVKRAVGNVMFVEAVGEEKFAVLSWITDYRSPGSLLYRARKDVIPLRAVNDCWSPPSARVRSSRLNRAGEPVLYTSADGPKVVLDEIEAKPGDAVSIIVYRVKEPLRLMILGTMRHYAYLNNEQQEKQMCLFAFLSSEFIRPVPSGAEYLYQISQVIAREHWGIYDNHDGWQYPSIKSGTYHNVCLQPGNAHRKLHLEGVICATVLSRCDKDLRTYNHFLARPQEDGSLRAVEFSKEHGCLLPGGELTIEGGELERARHYVRNLGRGSWQHLYKTEMERITIERSTVRGRRPRQVRQPSD